MPTLLGLRLMRDPDRSKRRQALLAIGFMLFALYYAVTALTQIYGFAWPQPTLDQFRLYAWYLELPFPDSVLQRENGHPPATPGLLRVLELHALAANQKLQIGFGAFCAAATAGVMAGVAWRERGLSLPLRAAAFMLAIIAVFWMANARMLLHGHELVHAYLLTLNVALAALAVWQARQRPWLGMTQASLCGVLATFCFGPGMALFPALIVTGFALRLPWRCLVLPLAALGLCLALYLWVLPGNASVRSDLHFAAFEIMTTATRWLASPWVNAWLGFATPALIPGTDESLLQRAPWLVESANGLQQLTGLSWSYGLALLFGSLEWLVLARALWCLRRSPQAWTRLEILAMTLMLFGAATAGLVAIARLDYFARLPGQIFADRYLIWPCLFWLGAFLFLAAHTRHGPRAGRVGLLLLAACVAWGLLPTNASWSGWGQAVYQNTAASAAAVRSDVFDARLLVRDDPSVSLKEKLKSLALFRERRLAMFSRPGPEWLGQPAPFAISTPPPGRLEILARHVIDDDLREGQWPIALRITGLMASKPEASGADGELVVLDDGNRIAGFAERSFTRPGGGRLRRLLPGLQPKNGFDAYIRAFDPARTYRLLVVDPDFTHARVIGVLHAAQVIPR